MYTKYNYTYMSTIFYTKYNYIYEYNSYMSTIFYTIFVLNIITKIILLYKYVY